MQVPRPPAVGDAHVISDLRPVLFSEPILGAASARPKRYVWALVARWIWWAGPLIAKNVTDPLPATPIYLAMTPVDFRLFAKSLGSQPIEIGRWPKSSYRASLARKRRTLRLDLDLDRLGRITLTRGPLWEEPAMPVFELIVQGASGPVVLAGR